MSLIAAKPGIDQLRGRPLVIAATEDDEEDARVSAIARALGVPVNVPDRPELCTFALPAIVDRGEVTVAIGTSGASPVLAQRLRAWLEQELHPRLDALAKLAGEFRGPVAESAALRPAAPQILGGGVRRRCRRSHARRRRGQGPHSDRGGDRRGREAPQPRAACFWSAPVPAIPNFSP